MAIKEDEVGDLCKTYRGNEKSFTILAGKRSVLDLEGSVMLKRELKCHNTEGCVKVQDFLTNRED
jgi:hypothetical protein